MSTPATLRLYLRDEYAFEADATVVAIRDGAAAFDRTCFYPGGGGQPPDDGFVTIAGGPQRPIISASADEDGVIWHAGDAPLPGDAVGCPARLSVNRVRRLALMRYHTMLHVLNTIVLREYGGWITGVHMEEDHARIDFKLEGFSPALCAALEGKVNAVLRERRALRSYEIAEDEFRLRPDLLRTLQAKPPVVGGHVRVVEIDGFDAQACGGTHVHDTGDVGILSIYRTENKGRINKRLYLRIASLHPQAAP